MNKNTLYFDATGPMVRYWSRDKMLHICDLNPETELRWRMTRWELFRFGLRCLLRSLRAA